MKLLKRVLSTIAVIFGIYIVGVYLYSELSPFIVDFFVKKPWSGSYYNSLDSELAESGKFKTLEECEDWAYGLAKTNGKEIGKWKYSCGKNCKYTGRTPGSITDNYECEEIVPDPSYFIQEEEVEYLPD